MSSMMTLFTFLMSSHCLVAAGQTPSEAVPADFNWKDFETAIDEEDCFGSDCGAASSSLSMLQNKASLRDRKRAEEAANQEPAITADMPYMEEVDELMSAFEAEDSANMGPDMEAVALQLIQTDAHVERKSIPSTRRSHRVVSTNADGTFDMNPKFDHASVDGMMGFSVDSHGGLHAEEALSLVQKEASMVHKAAAPSDGQISATDEVSGVSLIQTGALLGQKNKVSVQADGSFETPHESHVPSDGNMVFSFDANGQVHAEEGFSLMQTDAVVQQSELAVSPHETLGQHPSWSAEALSSWGEDDDAEAISLIQTDAKAEKKAEAPQLMTISVNALAELQREL
jgi:hypothetical protein